MARILDISWMAPALPDGRFRCPHCGGDRECRRASLRPWLALFGRRVLRIGRARTFSVCRTCGRIYAGPDTERDAATTPRSEDERAILGIVAAVIFSDSRVRATEKRAAREVIRRYAGLELRASELESLLRGARRRWGEPMDRLQRLSSLLDDASKRRIVEAAYLVSTADRELHSQESRLIHRIGEALDLPPREVTNAIQRARHATHGPERAE